MRLETWGKQIVPSLARHRRFLFWFPTLYALVLGTRGVLTHVGDPLDPDAYNYMLLAQQWTLKSFWGGFREPLWPGILSIPVRLFGFHPPVIRVMGVGGFVLMVGAAQLLIRRLYGAGWAIIAGTALAASNSTVSQAHRGLREEAAAGLLLLFGLAVLAKLSSRRLVGLWVLAGLTALLRWDTAFVTVPILGLVQVFRRPPARAALAGLACFAIMSMPLLVGNYLQSGDPLYHSNIHARYFRNIEFREFANFEGPPITWPQYLFGRHRLGTLVSNGLHGIELIEINNTTYFWFGNTVAAPIDTLPLPMIPGDWPKTLIWAAVLLAAVGWFSLLLTKAWPIALMLPLSVGVYAEIAQFIDYRLVLSTIPLTLIAQLRGLAIVLPKLFWAVEARVDKTIRGVGGATTDPKLMRLL